MHEPNSFCLHFASLYSKWFILFESSQADQGNHIKAIEEKKTFSKKVLGAAL
jgi:hypothetical protein